MASTTNRITSASSIAIATCLLISSSKISSEFTTQPPVSIIENSCPHHSTLPYCRSRVVPATSFTIAFLDFVRRLNRVDFPTLGRPTIATIFPIIPPFFIRLTDFPSGWSEIRINRVDTRNSSIYFLYYASLSPPLRTIRDILSFQKKPQYLFLPKFRPFSMHCLPFL